MEVGGWVEMLVVAGIVGIGEGFVEEGSEEVRDGKWGRPG